MEEREQAKNNGLSTASVVFGALALLTGFTIVLLPFNFGLSITFALLSRGSKKLPSLAVVGIVLSVIGLVIAALMCAFFGMMMFSLISNSFGEYQELLRDMIGAVGKAGGFYA